MNKYTKTTFLIICFLSFNVLFLPAINAQEQKTTAAVMDLEAKEGIPGGLTSTLSDYLRTQLFNTNEFTMVTRENMEQILKEQKFQLSGCTSKECIVEVGQLLGVRKMFAGSVGKAGATYVINIRLIDVQSGKIEKAVSEECAECKEDALLVSIKNITSKLSGVGIVAPVEEKLKKKTQEAAKPTTGKTTTEIARPVASSSIGREDVQITTYNMGFFEKNVLDKANKLYEQKKYDEALAAYQELRDKYMENPIAWYGMGAVYYAVGIYDLAIDKFSTAIKVDPNFSTAMKWLGNCYMKKGNKEEAAKYWKMAEDVLKNKVKR